VNLNPKIHYYTLHYNGVDVGDFFTNKKGLVSCKYCLQLIDAAEQSVQSDSATGRRSIEPLTQTVGQTAQQKVDNHAGI